MRTLIPQLRYEAEVPEYMRTVIGSIYEYLYGHPQIVCIGAKEGSLAMTFSVLKGFDKNKFPFLFNSFQHHNLVYDVTDKEMIDSGLIVVYSTLNAQYIDFLFPLEEYSNKMREILLDELTRVRQKFDEYSMHTLSSIAMQLAVLNYSMQSGTIQSLVFPISEELLSYQLKCKLNSYEIRLLLQYYAIPACGLPVSDKQYQKILNTLREFVEEVVPFES